MGDTRYAMGEWQRKWDRRAEAGIAYLKEVGLLDLEGCFEDLQQEFDVVVLEGRLRVRVEEQELQLVIVFFILYEFKVPETGGLVLLENGDEVQVVLRQLELVFVLLVLGVDELYKEEQDLYGGVFLVDG